ncbi:MAG: hypothetical protein ACXACY_29300 [Candidatus Hodarchaeales archaeon]
MLERKIEMNDKWMEKHFDERQIEEIKLCLSYATYATECYNGTNGHNVRMVIAKMAGLLSDDVHILDNKTFGTNGHNL